MRALCYKRSLYENLKYCVKINNSLLTTYKNNTNIINDYKSEHNHDINHCNKTLGILTYTTHFITFIAPTIT